MMESVMSQTEITTFLNIQCHDLMIRHIIDRRKLARTLNNM